MIFLDQLFELKVNKTMALKSLNLLETEYHEYTDIINRCLNRIHIMEVCDILKCNSSILEQFYFVIYPLDKLCNRIAFFFFKKLWCYDIESFDSNKGKCYKSFIIDFLLDVPEAKNWKYIRDGKIDEEDINICYLDEHNIKIEDYTNYSSIFKDYIDSEFECSNFWGEIVGPKNIDWILTLESIIKQQYGGLYSKDNTPNFYTFSQHSLLDIYLPNFSDNYIYQFVEKYTSFKCDYCDYFFGKNQTEKCVWHNSNYGDLCNSCYLKLKKDYFLKLQKNRQNILLLARKRIFKLEVAITKRILDQITLPELTLEKKNSIYQKVLKQMNKERKTGTCGICLDTLRENISAGSCGHCFHTKCLENMIGNRCPYCRTKTLFTKLHLTS